MIRFMCMTCFAGFFAAISNKAINSTSSKCGYVHPALNNSNTNQVEDSMGINFSTVTPIYSFIEHPLKLSPVWGKSLLNRPKPTNAWWNNLVLEEGADPLALYPYLFKFSRQSFVFCDPDSLSTSDFVVTPFVDVWALRASNQELDMKVTDYDHLGVEVVWQNSECRIKSYMLRGSPYITLEMNNCTLKLKTIDTIKDGEDTTTAFQQNRYTVTLNNGQIWFFYTEKKMAWAHDSNNLWTNNTYTGIFRICRARAPIAHNAQILDRFSTVYAVKSSSVNYKFEKNSSCHITFEFKKVGRDEPLLLFALPHHLDSLVNNHTTVALKGYSCIKGALIAIAGDKWTFKEELNNITWHSPSKINPLFKKIIKEALVIDKSTEIDPETKDPYFFGKAIARLARLLLIDSHLDSNETTDEILPRLKKHLESWLLSRNENKILYDQTYGGLVTSFGIKDSMADFGNGWYNDHHFHYGYFVYAMAVVGKFDKSWLHRYKTQALLFVRDYANYNNNDQYFTMFRNKDFYDGHSWASGLFKFGDGKNMESTSESVNSYYAMYLLGLALEDEELANVGNMLLSTELRSCKKYWQMSSSAATTEDLDSSDIYPVEFSKNKVVGILWSSKVDYSTWFGKNAKFIYSIQMLPFTPISHSLLDKKWVREADEVFMDTVLAEEKQAITDGWHTYLYMASAIVNSTAYIAFNNTSMQMDNGNTLSNTLYWFATQDY